MWAVCASGWMFLLSLAVVLLSSGSPVQSSVPDIKLFCCGDKENPIVKRQLHTNVIKHCYEQKKRPDCEQHAFVVSTQKKKWCINSTATWINKRLQKGLLNCTSDIQL